MDGSCGVCHSIIKWFYYIELIQIKGLTIKIRSAYLRTFLDSSVVLVYKQYKFKCLHFPFAHILSHEAMEIHTKWLQWLCCLFGRCTVRQIYVLKVRLSTKISHPVDKNLTPLTQKKLAGTLFLYTSLERVRTECISLSSQKTTILPSYWIKFNSLVHLREKTIADQIIQN